MTDPSDAPDQLEPDAGAGVGRVGPVPATSDARVDRALADLRAVVDGPLEQQVEAYVGAHRALQDRLADLDG